MFTGLMLAAVLSAAPVSGATTAELSGPQSGVELTATLVRCKLPDGRRPWISPKRCKRLGGSPTGQDAPSATHRAVAP